MKDNKFRAWDEERRMMDTNPRWMEFRVRNGVLKAFNFNRANVEQELVVMQFTGLRDKNGTEIYEGDILKNNKGTCKVVWDKRIAGFILNNNETIFKDPITMSFSEVVGNIYEDKELL